MWQPIKGKKAVCFDMFSTLAEPHDRVKHFEYEPFGITEKQWKEAFWSPELTVDRGLGRVTSPREMTERACALLPVPVTEQQITASVNAHLERMRLALCDLPEEILPTLRELKNRGYLLAIISDCDYSDIAYWKDSPLYPVMDGAVFSCLAGVRKPDPKIFQAALQQLGCQAEDAVYVGDGGSDELRGSKSLGFTSVRTEYLYRRPEAARVALDPYSDYVISHFTELTELLPPLR